VKIQRRKTGRRDAMMTLEEKLFVVAVYGDISWNQRNRLFQMSEFPTQFPQMLRDGRDYVARIAGIHETVR
jgi:hypothetical protein